METTQKKSTKIVGIKNAGLVIICCFILLFVQLSVEVLWLNLYLTLKRLCR